MTRILILGEQPAPGSDAASTNARARHFADTLASDGHAVLSAAVRRRREGGTDGGLQEAAARFRPGAAVGVGPRAASAALSSLPGLPLWADLEGWPPAGTCGAAIGEWRTARRPVLAGADLFSAPSEEDRLMLIGELAAQGRLCARNAGIDIVFHIPAPGAPGGAMEPLRRWARAPSRTGRPLTMGDLTVLPELLDREEIADRLGELRRLKRSPLLRALLFCARIKNAIPRTGA